jgi:hypothetical protein
MGTHAEIAPPGASRVEQSPFLREVLIDLLHEERVAFGFLEHGLRKP